MSLLLMEAKDVVFIIYLIFGILMIIFSSKISEFFYKMVLLYTNKMNLKDLFLFKVNNKNRDSLFSLARYITIFIGLVIISTCLYLIYL